MPVSAGEVVLLSTSSEMTDETTIFEKLAIDFQLQES